MQVFHGAERAHENALPALKLGHRNRAFPSMCRYVPSPYLSLHQLAGWQRHHGHVLVALLPLQGHRGVRLPLAQGGHRARQEQLLARLGLKVWDHHPAAGRLGSGKAALEMCMASSPTCTSLLLSHFQSTHNVRHQDTTSTACRREGWASPRTCTRRPPPSRRRRLRSAARAQGPDSPRTPPHPPRTPPARHDRAAHRYPACHSAVALLG